MNSAINSAQSTPYHHYSVLEEKVDEHALQELFWNFSRHIDVMVTVRDQILAEHSNTLFSTRRARALHRHLLGEALIALDRLRYEDAPDASRASGGASIFGRFPTDHEETSVPLAIPETGTKVPSRRPAGFDDYEAIVFQKLREFTYKKKGRLGGNEVIHSSVAEDQVCWPRTPEEEKSIQIRDERRRAEMLERREYQQETSQDPSVHPTTLSYWLAPSWDKRTAPPEGSHWERSDKDLADQEAMDQLKKDLGITRKRVEDPFREAVKRTAADFRKEMEKRREEQRQEEHESSTSQRGSADRPRKIRGGEGDDDRTQPSGLRKRIKSSNPPASAGSEGSGTALTKPDTSKKSVAPVAPAPKKPVAKETESDASPKGSGDPKKPPARPDAESKKSDRPEKVSVPTVLKEPSTKPIGSGTKSRGPDTASRGPGVVSKVTDISTKTSDPAASVFEPAAGANELVAASKEAHTPKGSLVPSAPDPKEPPTKSRGVNIPPREVDMGKKSSVDGGNPTAGIAEKNRDFRTPARKRSERDHVTPMPSSDDPSSSDVNKPHRPADFEERLYPHPDSARETASASPRKLPKAVKRSRLLTRSPEQESKHAKRRAMRLDYYDLYYRFHLATGAASYRFEPTERQALEAEVLRREETLEGFGVARTVPTSDEQKQEEALSMTAEMSTRHLVMHLEYIQNGSRAYNDFQQRALNLQIAGRPEAKDYIGLDSETDSDEGNA
ncbi:unnamed protein product [Penicillium crustosum]